MTRDEYRDNLVRLLDLEHKDDELIAGEMQRLEYNMEHTARITDHVLRFVAAMLLAASGQLLPTVVAMALALVYAYRITTQEGF